MLLMKNRISSGPWKEFIIMQMNLFIFYITNIPSYMSYEVRYNQTLTYSGESERLILVKKV